MAVSAKGFEGLGPVFRVDATLDTHGTPQAQNGKVGFSNGSGMISHGPLYIVYLAALRKDVGIIPYFESSRRYSSCWRYTEE